ncbi:hypothetical protein [Streptomyces sp. CB02400]|uniref:hypothetical protein n=1 Tax=Streptomyces sp. CB02400 TaxID=1703944 RepID=UPI00093D5024|nr:hypothetical protein [Streptomyces sp. CB02400]
MSRSICCQRSGVSLLPQVRRTYAPRGRTPTLRHRLNWKRAGVAAALAGAGLAALTAWAPYQVLFAAVGILTATAAAAAP